MTTTRLVPQPPIELGTASIRLSFQNQWKRSSTSTISPCVMYALELQQRHQQTRPTMHFSSVCSNSKSRREPQGTNLQDKMSSRSPTTTTPNSCSSCCSSFHRRLAPLRRIRFHLHRQRFQRRIDIPVPSTESARNHVRGSKYNQSVWGHNYRHLYVW
jgi:hypothetical protein